MQSVQMEMINPSWNNSGLTSRMIDVINQCKYLASKKGMTLKELRKSLREDEARQRELIRQNEYKREAMMSQSQYVDYPGGISSSHGLSPPWAVHVNNDGALYSQYNVESYGRSGEWTGRGADGKKATISALEKERLRREDSDEEMMNLLYFASINQNEKGRPGSTMMSRISRSTLQHPQQQQQPPTKPPSRTGGSTGWIEPETVANLQAEVDKCDSTNSLNSCSSLEEADVSVVDLPVRKMGSHDLASLRKEEETESKNGEDEDISLAAIMATDDFSISDDEDGNDEIGSLETQPTGEDGEKRVVSPLLKKVETAFADLQKNDSVFGNMDDFGHLMEKIL